MRLYAPRYYKNFKCIADKCPHSCCIGWRIGVDDETLEKYDSLPPEYGWIKDSVKVDSDGAYLQLGCDGRCPHLAESGLCRIISALGDEYIAAICQEHPRFYNDYGGYTELGIGASCPEAARIITESEYLSLDLEEMIGDKVFMANGVKKDLLDILKKSKNYAKIEMEIVEKYALPKNIIDIDIFNPILSELEYLSEDHRDLFLNIKSSDSSTDNSSLQNVLAYLLFRHVRGDGMDIEIRAEICFALLGTRMVDAIAAVMGCGITEALRIFSEEIEYSTDNTDVMIMEIEGSLI